MISANHWKLRKKHLMLRVRIINKCAQKDSVHNEVNEIAEWSSERPFCPMPWTRYLQYVSVFLSIHEERTDDGFMSIRAVGGRLLDWVRWLEGREAADYQPGQPPTDRPAAGKRLGFAANADNAFLHAEQRPNSIWPSAEFRAMGIRETKLNQPN